MKHWTREIEYNRGERIIRKISEQYATALNDYDLFIVGATHSNIDKKANELLEFGANKIEIPRDQTPMKFRINPLLWFIPKATSFAFYISPKGNLSSCLKLLDDYLTVDIILVPHSNGETVRSILEEGNYSRDQPEIFQLEQHFVYGFDTDHPEYDTGIEEFVSSGHNGPQELIASFAYMERYEEYALRVFKNFMESGELPEKLEWGFPDYTPQNKKLDQTFHYLSHVVTDKDIRAKDPELDEIMRTELRRMINDLGVF